MKSLKNQQPAIILHIDMLGEGMDVSGITGVMAFSPQGRIKLMQLLGRAMRLHDLDRQKLYQGKFFNGMDREANMVKPYAYVVVPLFLRDSNDLYANVREHMQEIHTNYGFNASVINYDSKTIGSNETLCNSDFKALQENYDSLEFNNSIEFDYKPKDKEQSYNEPADEPTNEPVPPQSEQLNILIKPDIHHVASDFKQAVKLNNFLKFIAGTTTYIPKINI